MKCETQGLGIFMFSLDSLDLEYKKFSVWRCKHKVSVLRSVVSIHNSHIPECFNSSTSQKDVQSRKVTLCVWASTCTIYGWHIEL